MSIFVDEQDAVKITVRYVVEPKGVKVLDDGQEPPDGCESVTAEFRRPNFGLAQQLMRASTTIDANGQPSLNIADLNHNMLYLLLKSWDVKDSKGEPVEPTPGAINRMRIEVARALVTRLVNVVGTIM